MNNSLYSRFGYGGLISLLTLCGILTTLSAQAACYKTPRSAIDSLQANSSVSVVSESSGYRVTGMQSDPVLGQRWVMISNCSHPEWPAVALQAIGTTSLKMPIEGNRSLIENVRQTPVIRAGDIVRLWRQEELLRIEVAGVSEESANLGQTVRVRLLRGNTDDQSIPEQFSGVVRGPSNVEILP
jgi:Chaperone for flagella basal body P-ring formation